jgi:AcrR family transcriptional regulator
VVPVPGKLPGRRERHRAETRDRLIGAAFGLFAERGFMATTVEDITNAADVGKGTYFNYFPSKEHLLVEFSRIQGEKTREFILSNIRSTSTIEHVLHKLAVVATEACSQSPELVQSLLVPVFASPEVRRQLVENLDKERVLLARLLAGRQKKSELRDDLTPDEMARLYQQSIFGTVIIWSLDSSKPIGDRLKEMLDVFLSGIRRLEKDR